MKRATRRRAAAVLSAATLAAGLPLGAASATGTAPRGAPAAPGDLRLAGAGETAVPDGWIVVLKDTGERAVPGVARDLVGRSGGARLGHVYRAALRGFSATMSRARAERVAADPRVAYVRQDTRVRLDAAALDETQPNAPWGLDRIDQRLLPLSGTYTYRTTAPDVRVYVIDTGLRTTHQEFGGRASVGVDTVGDGQNGNDCHGHGTHVGAIAAGRTYGVAKQASVVAVRVLNCQGSATTAGVVAGVDWVTAQKARPAVANMSIGGQGSDVLDNAVRNSIRSGVTYAVSAGSEGSSTGACSTSPARLPEAVTVGASDRADRRASSSNYGPCVSLFAPGVQIPSAWKDSDTSTNTISGTSMATAHVAGAAALHLAFRPADTPAQVKRGLIDHATTGVLQGTPPVVPNKLLYTLYLQKSGHTV
ncbi:S8 family peptidase [Streptomyces spectabilis]|uniref:S8 family peptidase n=1 Tax=Streptomyces spectabilis TaxID=68270 RepID=A0A516RHW9_STRST|nr:S8 family peptidase [Streptomyces spectabilis]QDQ15251.1 S8 family peptidase [Streptomyces spectabilis]